MSAPPLGLPLEPFTETSTNGKIGLINSVPMIDGPHHILIVPEANALFAARDNNIFRFSLANPALPTLEKTYVGPTVKFTHILKFHRHLIVPCGTDKHLYMFDQADLSLTAKLKVTPEYFQPSVSTLDSEGFLWLGGSNGASTVVGKYTFDGAKLTLVSQWTGNTRNGGVASIVQCGAQILASINGGDILSFSRAALERGPVSVTTFDAEGGHEKWGKTLTINEATGVAFWANWGAGFSAVDVSDPAKPRVVGVLSNSVCKPQNNNDGTNCYDVAYNPHHKLALVANGWSGVLLINPETPTVLADFIKVKNNQNYSIATYGDYVYVGNISGGMSGKEKGIKVYRLK